MTSKKELSPKLKNTIILSIMGVAIIALVVLIIVFSQKQQSEDSSSDTPAADSTLNAQIIKIRKKLEEKIAARDKDAVISEYDKMLGETDSNEDKATIYLARVFDLNRTCGIECKDDILDDAKKAEELNPNGLTAATLCTYSKLLYADESEITKWCNLDAERTPMRPGFEDKG